MNKFSKPLSILYLVPFGILVILVFYKSYAAAFTHDEAFSYLTFSSKSIRDILSFKVDTSANNHLFNTLYMKLSGAIGLEHPFFLRLLSSSSFVLFLYSTIQLSQTENENPSILLALLVCSSPYLLDFFSMARGYGLSFGLMVYSIYLLLKTESSQAGIWSMQVATLAMLCNFNLVYFWAAFGIIHFVSQIQRKENKEHFIWFCFKSYLFPILALIYLYLVFNRLKEAQQLYFGGSVGLLENLINDQLWCLVYDQNYKHNALYLQIWQYLPVGLILIACSLFPIRIIRTNQAYQDWIKVLIILLIAFGLIELNHRLTGSLYPIKRTGLFMSVLLGTCLLLFFRFLVAYRLLRIPTLTVGVGICAVLYYHTLSSYQSQRYREIPYDSHHHEILQTLESLATPKEPILDLSANWQLGPSLNFYKKTKSLNWLPETTRDPIRNEAQYLLVFEEDMKTLDMKKQRILKHFPDDGLYLLKQDSTDK